MTTSIKHYWIPAALVAAALIQHFTTNSTIDALTGLIVWGTLGIVSLVAVLMLLMGWACHAFTDSIKTVDGLDKAADAFKQLKMWKSFIVLSIVLGTFIYVDWPGPAVLHTINFVVMWSSVFLLRSGILKVCEKNGIELPKSTKADDSDDLKKSVLDI